MLIKILNKLSYPFIYLRDFLIESSLNNLSEKELFTSIYKSGYWKPLIGGSLSGSGSSEEATVNIKKELPHFLSNRNIKSILDIPCGDFNWMAEIDLSSVKYIGAEIVEELVLNNQNNFSKENRSFIVCDLLKDDLPSIDLIFVRDCFVHLTDVQIQTALSNIINSDAKYFASSTYPNIHENIKSKKKDRWRALNLTSPPFSLPEPLEELDDGWPQIELHANKKIGIWLMEDLKKQPKYQL